MTQDFKNFDLPEKLIQALDRIGFTTPTPIQQQAIPVAMAGKDIIGSAQTGTGKTGAFGIPLIAQLMTQPHAHALILTPTRELATQVMATLQQFIPVPTIKTALLIGGEAMPKQFKQLQQNPRLIVGTPGRVHDHLERGTLKLVHTSFLILDETDRMLDMGFGVQLDKIMRFMLKKRQTMMFSATMPSNIMALSQKYLSNPVRLTVGEINTPTVDVDQQSIHTSEADKYTRLQEELAKRDGTVILFVKTKFGADRMARRLVQAGHQADAIHGDLSQNRRDRVIAGFRDKKFRILVATDVAARGLDIPHIAHVMNYDLPQAPEDYIHRIGRTARAGATGSALNFVTPADGLKWKAIQRLIGGKEAVNESASPARKAANKKPFRRFSSAKKPTAKPGAKAPNSFAKRGPSDKFARKKQA
jgi:ATP-dependent RNA helicase DeaD